MGIKYKKIKYLVSTTINFKNKKTCNMHVFLCFEFMVLSYILVTFTGFIDLLANCSKYFTQPSLLVICPALLHTAPL